jgi:hypothetical protein
MLDDRCPRCRHPLRLGLHFCTHCGVRLTPLLDADTLTLRWRRIIRARTPRP